MGFLSSPINFREHASTSTGTAKLVDVVWVQIISMQILPTDVVPILTTIMQVLPTGMLPILTSMMQGVLGQFNLEFAKDKRDSVKG